MRLPRFFVCTRLVACLVTLVVVLINANCTNTLNRAIYREKPEAVQKFLAEGANVNEANDDGGTPLIYAAQYGDLALIKTLVARGATVNWTDKKGNSALCYLASDKTFKNDTIAFLLTHGANVNLANEEGLTPLHLAVARHVEVNDFPQQEALVFALLEAGADANLQTYRGELALHLAAAAGQPDEVLTRLLAVTKDPQTLTRSGYTALSEAAKAGQHGSARFLVAHGFEPQAIVPAAHLADQLPIVLNVAHPINARSHEAMGDFLVDRNEGANALTHYQSSAASYNAAVAECQHAVSVYDEALKNAKAGRKGRIVSTIALNTLGAGLAAATGVGFFAVPKKTNNHIDDFAERLAHDQAELATLLREQTALSAKLQKLENSTKSNGVPSAAVAEVVSTNAPVNQPAAP